MQFHESYLGVGTCYHLDIIMQSLNMLSNFQGREVARFHSIETARLAIVLDMLGPGNAAAGN